MFKGSSQKRGVQLHPRQQPALNAMNNLKSGKMQGKVGGRFVCQFIFILNVLDVEIITVKCVSIT